MTPEATLWLHSEQTLTIEELGELSGLSAAQLRELVECGVFAPTDPGAARPSYSADRLLIARSVRRLCRDFDLEPGSMTLVATLLERIGDLERELRELRAKLPGGSS